MSLIPCCLTSSAKGEQLRNLNGQTPIGPRKNVQRISITSAHSLSIHKRTLMIKNPLEKVVELQILRFLEVLELYVWKNESQGTFDQKTGSYRKGNHPFKLNGVADIIGVLAHGRILCIEVKRSKGGKVSKEQANFIASVNLLGGLAFVAKGWLEVAEHLAPYYESIGQYQVLEAGIKAYEAQLEKGAYAKAKAVQPREISGKKVRPYGTLKTALRPRMATVRKGIFKT